MLVSPPVTHPVLLRTGTQAEESHVRRGAGYLFPHHWGWLDLCASETPLSLNSDTPLWCLFIAPTTLPVGKTKACNFRGWFLLEGREEEREH